MTFYKAIPVYLAGLSVVTVAVWLGVHPRHSLEERVPGRDVYAEVAAGRDLPRPTGQPKLLKLGGAPADLPGSWPRFRGPNLDGIAAAAGLMRQWPEGGPKVLWSVDLGEGYAGAAVLAGRVFVLDYDQAERADAMRCFSLADGKEIWRYSYPVDVKRNHGMSRTVPAVTEKYVVGLGPKCHVTCLDVATGEPRWKLDLVGDFKAKVPRWYAGQCPLIDGDKVIIATGGDALLIAVDISSGQVIWKSPNPWGWAMTYSSVLPLEFHGNKMYVYCGSGGVAGVSVEDGRTLWGTESWQILIAMVPTPVDLGEGRIFLSGGYNAGSLFLQLRGEDDKLVAEPGRKLEADVFGSTQQTPIFYQGHVYGVRPDGELVCLDPSGKVVWTSGTQNRFGLASFLIADGMIFVLNEAGVLALVRATPERFDRLSQAQVLSGQQPWGPMALAGGRLIARDLTRMVCIDVKGN